MIRGDICMMDFGIPFGSEPGHRRPVIVIQSNKDNLEKLNTTVVIPLTSNTINANYSGNVFLAKSDTSLPKDSVALVHQIIVVDKQRLEEKLSKISKSKLIEIEKAIDYVLKDW